MAHAWPVLERLVADPRLAAAQEDCTDRDTLGIPSGFCCEMLENVRRHLVLFLRNLPIVLRQAGALMRPVPGGEVAVDQ